MIEDLVLEKINLMDELWEIKQVLEVFLEKRYSFLLRSQAGKLSFRSRYGEWEEVSGVIRNNFGVFLQERKLLIENRVLEIIEELDKYENQSK